MTSAFLQSELASLVQDSKRRSSDVRTAAEKSLADLKAIHVTSETQLAADLLRRPQFIDPFILACNSKHAKLAVTGAVCLQRLVASRAIPPTRLEDVLDAFQDATHQGLDVQLKVLQALPSLLQLYNAELQGDPLAKILSLSANLAGNKTLLVSSTAIATFQQLIATVFEKQAQARIQNGREEIDEQADAPRIFADMCAMVRGESPTFLKPQGLYLHLALEAVESSLSNQELQILKVPSCFTVCRTHLIPGIIELLERTANFLAFGRGLRTLYLLITQYLDAMAELLLDSLSSVLSIIDKPSGPSWRRVLCLEFMRSIVSEAQLTRSLFILTSSEDGRPGIIENLMAVLVRIAAEDPALIGLGRQSTIPTNNGHDGSVGVSGGAQVDIDASGSVLQASSSVTGISSRWSTIEKPLLEQLDRNTPPEIPATYIYTLVLGCVASFSDGMSKFVMPLSVPNRASLDLIESEEIDGEPGVPVRKNSQVRRADKYQRLLNPLTREDISDKREIQSCGKMIEACWPAVLATCSTFLNSALDSDFYHMLIRAVQKLAQVSGVMELFTPRDALLTTLAKVSVPINASSVVTALHGGRLAKVSKDEEDNGLDDVSIKSPNPTTPRHSVDVLRQPLNVRNLLCLRALLNLGIALGPTLSETSWFIIVQALQQAEALMSVSPAARSAANRAQSQEETDMEGQSSLSSEIKAVNTASKRMIESTRTYTDETLKVLVSSIFKMIESLLSDSDRIDKAEETANKQEVPLTPRRHKASRSVSGVLATSVILHIEAEFVLKTISDIARFNLFRFTSTSSQPYTWDLIVGRLLSVALDVEVNPQLRLQAASTVDIVSMETIKLLERQDQEKNDLNLLQKLCLNALAKQVSALYKREGRSSSRATDVEVHRRLLEALENIVSHTGDSLTQGWQVVFEILERTTRETHANAGNEADEADRTERELVLARTISPAFRTVQLIVSDFINTIDPASFAVLVQLLPLFGTQKNDLNISLTTTTLFWNVSSVLLDRCESIEITSEEAEASDSTAVDISSLWMTTVRQLCVLCEDSGSEVRNSALKVLIRVFDSSSQHLTSRTWNVALQSAFLPLLKKYIGQRQALSEWHASFTQLLEGFVSLFIHNAETIGNSSDFSTTWTSLVAVLDLKLAQKDLASHTAVFLATTELLGVLPKTKSCGEYFVHPILRSWSENHPADIEVTDKSNQDALCAHATLLAVVDRVANGEADSFSLNGKKLVQHAMAASRRSVFASIHPPYTSDVIKLAPEQKAVVVNLSILKRMMVSSKQEYTEFLLDIVYSILTRNMATDIEQQKETTGSKSLKRPTLIAFISHCISCLREIVKEEASQDEYFRNTSTSKAISTLTHVAATKYRKALSGGDPPVWQNATSCIVELLESLKSLIDHLRSEEIMDLAPSITRAVENVLNAPALEQAEPHLSPEVVSKDENFDVNHFQRFHKASLPFLQHPAFPSDAQKEYVVALFHASLIAKPWFGDIPDSADLLLNPLSKFTTLRPGSVRPPDLYSRTNIPYEALEALLRLLVTPDADKSPNTTSSSSTKSSSTLMAPIAAPYVLLRVAHTIKVFLSDQRLRYLTPPPRPLQKELNVVLNRALQLHVDDAAFKDIIPHARPCSDDGRAHLRILYPLILQMKEFWVRLPRSRICPWQEDEDGKDIERALESWGESISEEWHI